jgi:UDP-2-acetamido-2,6-beta-L-arabino-hexul-4-ose reductase
VNIIRPGIVKGNHWHHSKTEKYLVVSGKCTTRLRQVGSDKVTELVTSGEKLEVIDIPTGYTHNIENTGDTDAAVFMWVNEPFDPGHPDTIPLNV